MSPLRRRSSRLKGSQAKVEKFNSTPRRLSDLGERDETSQMMPPVYESIPTMNNIPQTPSTAPRIKPAFQEMHPGKGHSASSPSFDYRHVTTPATAGRIKPDFKEMHPGKSHSTMPLTADFKFTRPGPQLGPEAQKMMDELREEALRIKTKMMAERDQEKVDEPAPLMSVRKFATPKGKVGRYSGAHMAEFKKMDSIAGHASSFRAQPGRSVPVTSSAPKSLKRTQSKAKLSEREELDKSTSASLNTIEEGANDNGTPAKRARVFKRKSEEVKVPVEPETPKRLVRSRSILESLTTPTQASLARSHATQNPSLSHSPSKQNLTAPLGLTKSVTMGNLSAIKKSGAALDIEPTPGRLARMKSMLRRPIVSPEKSTSYIPASASRAKLNLQKELPPLPNTPSVNKLKDVTCTPRTINKCLESVQASPSPFKSAIPRSKSHANFSGDVVYPSLSSVMNDPAKEVPYPVLPKFEDPPAVTQQKSNVIQAPPPSVPGTFTFRSDHTISFGTSPRSFGSSPGQSSLRQVRPSIFPGSMPGAFPFTAGDNNNNKENKENTPPILSISHGMPNKKRHRADSEDEKSEDEKELERSPKKHKGLAGVESPKKLEAMSPVKMTMAIERERLAPKSRIPSPSKKGLLSMSRLNMLARPKMRR